MKHKEKFFHFFNFESKKRRSLKGRHHFQIQPHQRARPFAQGTQTEGEGSVHLTSSLRQLVFVKKANYVINIEMIRSKIVSKGGQLYWPFPLVRISWITPNFFSQAELFMVHPPWLCYLTGLSLGANIIEHLTNFDNKQERLSLTNTLA